MQEIPTDSTIESATSRGEYMHMAGSRIASMPM